MPSQSLVKNSRSLSRTRRYEAQCASCNKLTTIPFRPSPDRPVYCHPCFKSRRNIHASPSNGPLRRTTAITEAASDNHHIDEDSVFPGMALKVETRIAISKMQISEPTPIQAETIPLLLSGRDLIGQARTGSGKTLAFAIPMTEGADPTLRRVQALVLVPTRELAIQVATVVSALARPLGLRVISLYGGHSLRREYMALRGGAQIVIGTPGRTLDHLRQGSLKLQDVGYVILDEADEMLDKGFAHDVEAILSRTPSERQTALFSATMPKWVSRTAKNQLRNSVTVEIDKNVQSPTSVEHQVFTLQRSDKMEALRTLLDQRSGGPVLVFGRTKHGVKKLARQLDTNGYPVDALQGNLSQNARERVMAGFRSGTVSILVATNVAARGLDVEGIDQVINYDLPDSELLFTHRVGRTGRMGRAGRAFTFVTPDEEKKWREIVRGLGPKFASKPWHKVRHSDLFQGNNRP